MKSSNGEPQVPSPTLAEPALTQQTPDPGRLLRLAQLVDSALPIGAYSQSWGLEAAIHRGQVRGPEDLERWTRDWLHESIAPADGLLSAHAWRAAEAGDWDLLSDLNDLLTVNKVAPTLRKASINQGEAFLDLVAGWPWSGHRAAEIRASGSGPWHHAVLFGALAESAGASEIESLALYLQNAATSLITTAVRAVPIGHTHGQQVLSRIQPTVLELADRWLQVPLECFGGLCPAYEVLGYAQSQLYTRIFQS